MEGPMSQSKTEIKFDARERLMAGMQVAFARAADEGVSDEVYVALLGEFRRVEKFLGFEPGSYAAGC